ncbi:MAG: hypothetical protein ACI4JC_10700 [Faecalibacterium sp.]
MELDFYTLVVLYIVYSFLGWIGETVVATVRGKSFADRGLAAGPFCFVYGLAAVVMAVGFSDLKTQPAALFIFCSAAATVIEWLTGKLLERLHRRRWWDYSDKKFNLDGYVCPQYSVLWGVLGTVSVLWGNGLVFRLYSLLPGWVGRPLAWSMLALALLDQLASFVVVENSMGEHPWLEKLSRLLGQRTERMARGISRSVRKRIQHAYPKAAEKPAEAAAERMSLTDLLWLFVVGAFLGDVVETLFCRVTAGIWMSRSSVVWGPFSVVWGLALVMAAVLLRKSEDRSDSSIFMFGVVLGGAYEYICSAVGELLFGVVFWDYSDFMFNLGGRINLLYCLFWGVAAVVWLRYGLPLVTRMLNWLRRWIRPWMSAVLAVFMVVNMGLSALALARYDARMDGAAPANRFEAFLDAHFDNERMEKIYPNAEQVG